MATEQQPRPAEPFSFPEPEKKALARLITPSTARALGGVFDAALADGANVLDPARKDAFAAFLGNATPRIIHYSEIEAASMRSRADYGAGDPDNFAKRNEAWNEATWKWMKVQVADDSHLKADAKAAFTSLGVNVDNDEKTGELQTEVEKFRTKYLRGKSNIEQFVLDVANGCTENGQINMVTLERRLIAVADLTNAFGETYNLPALIKQCTVTHALLSQSREKKIAAAPLITPYLLVPAPDAARLYNRTRLEQNMPPSAARDRTVAAPRPKGGRGRKSERSNGESRDRNSTQGSNRNDSEGGGGGGTGNGGDGYSRSRSGGREDQHHGEHEHDPTTPGEVDFSDRSTTGTNSGSGDRSATATDYVPGDSDSRGSGGSEYTNGNGHGGGHDGGHDGDHDGGGSGNGGSDGDGPDGD